MKRYAVFAGMQYYPGGGWDDFVGAFDDIEEAMKEFNKKSSEWAQIVDTSTDPPQLIRGS